MPCVKSPPRTWRRKGNALLRIASDPACSDGPFDKPKFNWINCVRGGRRYSLQAQGDFCGTASDGLADALWPVGPACPPAGTRPCAETTLDATTRAALCTGGQDRAAPAPGAGTAPRGVWHPGGDPAGAGGLRLADPDGLRGAPQPDHPPACSRGGTAGQHALQGGGQHAAAAGVLSGLLQVFPAAHGLTQALYTPCAPQRHMLRADTAAT